MTDDLQASVKAASQRHAQVLASEPFQTQLAVLGSLTQGFAATLRTAWIASTRDPESGNAVFWRFTDDLLASAVGIFALAREGIDSMARRELRFMLELVIRHLYVDTCQATRTTPLEERVAYIERRLGTRDVALLKELSFPLLPDAETFRGATRRLYGELSSYVHPSHVQLARRLERAERGVYVGFETAAELHELNDLLRRCYDVILVFLFEALGHASAGDVMLAFDDFEGWPFHDTTFLSALSATFDYKAERELRRRASE